MSLGIAIITCDRELMFRECIGSVLKYYNNKPKELIVVNDGHDPIRSTDNYTVINNKANLGVGQTKNIAIKHLIEAGCDHIFIIEDDVELISNEVFESYIHLSEVSGVQHLNFCLHGEANKINSVAKPKLIIDYKDIQMALYHNVTGAISYYTKQVIEECGYMDDNYRNAMEHVDHTMKTINARYHPPFRWFADVAGSDQLIRDQDPSLVESKIRNDTQWEDNFRFGVNRFKSLYNIDVCDPYQACSCKEDVIDFLKDIKK